MAVLQIKIEDTEVLENLKKKAESKGLSMTSFARMKLYEEANSMNKDIEEGLRDLREGNVSPTFSDSKEAIAWLNN